MKRKSLTIVLVIAFLLLFSSLACSFCSIDAIDQLAEGSATDEENSAMGLESTYRGSIAVGESVTDELDDLLLAHDWTFEGRTGQTVTIRCEATPGEDTDPRINLIGPGDEWLISDDDGGDEWNALISNYTLPSDGTYTIKVDVFTHGEYVLILE